VSDGIIIAIDQGTSSTKAVGIDANGMIVDTVKVPLAHSSPQPGWVEQDAEEILRTVVEALNTIANRAEQRVLTIGISSQRESALVWDRIGGDPVGPMLGWQDRRTNPQAAEMLAAGLGTEVRSRTGLPLDPMFSALKWQWLLDQLDEQRTLTRSGRLVLGTVDAWLRWKLCGDVAIEEGNASRTQLYNINSGTWDRELCGLFNIPHECLAPIVPSDAISSPVHAGTAVDGVPIAGVMGDSHAALFGHGVRVPGSVKATFGTGSSIMGLADKDIPEGSGMAHTIAWSIAGIRQRAFEGNILSSGATVAWLAEVMHCTPDVLAEEAATVQSSRGLVMVPAFSGLGAPWWDDAATGIICGLGLGQRRPHFGRAAFESIAHQIADVLESADEASGQYIDRVLADGGPTRNDWLMGLVARLTGREVIRADVTELSAFGVATLAGQTLGVWSPEEVEALYRPHTSFNPTPVGAYSAATIDTFAAERERWREALARARLRPA